MKRVLVSQNERNNGGDYLIVDGVRVNDEDKVVYYGRMFSKTDSWKEICKDDSLEIRQNKNQLLIKSFYNDKDVAGRAIYYLYLVEEKSDNFDAILDYLEKDSQLLHRTFDRDNVQKVIEQIKQDEELKKKIITYIGILLGVLAVAYLITKIKS